MHWVRAFGPFRVPTQMSLAEHMAAAVGRHSILPPPRHPVGNRPMTEFTAPKHV